MCDSRQHPKYGHFRGDSSCASPAPKPVAPARIGEAEGRRGREPRVSFAFALVAMTHGTFLRVDNGALGVRAAAGWQPDAVRPDADVPGGGIGGRDRLPEMKGNSSMAFLTGMLRCMVG